MPIPAASTLVEVVVVVVLTALGLVAVAVDGSFGAWGWRFIASRRASTASRLVPKVVVGLLAVVVVEGEVVLLAMFGAEEGGGAVDENK